MNVHVNLIRSSELRGPGAFSFKLYLLVTGLILLLVLFLMTLALLQQRREQARQWDALERRWLEAQRNQATVEATQAELGKVEAWHRLVKGWETTRVPWHIFLEELQKTVPPDIQLRVLRMRAAPESRAGGEIVQLYHVLMDGYCGEPDAEQQVDELRRGLADRPAFVPWVERVQVTSFGEDTLVSARPEDRVFRLELFFYPRNFHETAGQ